MTTTYHELYTRVLLRLNKRDGEAYIAAKEAVNTAHKIIARVQDFDELITTDTTSAATVASTKTYHIEDDLSLTRPKDILSIRLMDDSNSRKLQYYSPRELDEVLPYVDQLGEQHPSIYTQRGRYIDIIPIPDDAYDLYIMHSQWPETLTDDDDETSYTDIDDVIITLASVIARDVLTQDEVTRSYQTANHDDVARTLLMGALKEERNNPDHRRVAKPFNPHRRQPPLGEWWLQPFTRRDP